jgi:hypothetical protein
MDQSVKATYLSNFNVDVADRDWTGSVVTNKNHPKIIAPEILRTQEKYDTQTNEGSMAILDSKNKDLDLLAQAQLPDPRKMSWKDMTMDIWRSHCRKSAGGIEEETKRRIQSLKYMARDEIGTPETRLTLEAATRHTGETTFRYGQEGREGEAFDAIAGTVHGSRVAFMLKDHHVELGELRIAAFHTIHEGDKWHMVIEFGRS